LRATLTVNEAAQHLGIYDLIRSGRRENLQATSRADLAALMAASIGRGGND
jgi:hypothetical protein